MSPAWIRKRALKVTEKRPRGGSSYQVLYRLGGRETLIKTAGSFKTEREAKLRRDLVAGWLAGGLNPKLELDKLLVAPTTRTIATLAPEYERSRYDIDPGTLKNIRNHLKRIVAAFGDRDPATLTVTDCIGYVGLLATELSPGTIAKHYATLRLLLDFAELDPNPARNRRAKLPTISEPEVVPPTAAHVLAILERVTPRWRLPLIVSEQTGMTVGELEQLQWGDVDETTGQFRLRRATVKAGIRSRARWVQVPDWLMAAVSDTCAVEDRVPARRVFPGFTGDGARNAMQRACRPRIPHYHPHDLRHRRLSLWHGQGVPAKELAARAGHSKASMTLDVYSHVMPLDELPATTLEAMLVMPR